MENGVSFFGNLGTGHPFPNSFIGNLNASELAAAKNIYMREALQTVEEEVRH